MGLPEEQYTYGLPLTLGHEGVGIVHALGTGVTEFAVGDAVAVYGPWGCGTCRVCAEGEENYCTRAVELGILPPGLGSPGSMAEDMIVDSPRHIVPLGDLDPVASVSLTDAGLTPHHAAERALPKRDAGSQRRHRHRARHHGGEARLGALPVGIMTTAWDVSVRAPYWGSRSKLIEVLELAHAGLIHVETEVFTLDDAPKACERLHEGSVRGRAVIVP